MAKKDYYATLGVPRNASADDLRRAFRALALKHHPDRNPGNVEADRRFKEAAEAWEVLGDAEQRARYDRLGPLYNASGRGPTPDELNEILKEALGGLFGLGKRAGGEELRHALSVTLEEAARGAVRDVIVVRNVRCKPCEGSGASTAGRQPCTNCSGTGKDPARKFFRAACSACMGRGFVVTDSCARCSGEGRHPQEEVLKVRIPAGVVTGQKLRLKGKGNDGAAAGTPAGDLYVVVSVLDHPLFRRRGADLLCELPLTWAEAVLGADVGVPMLDGTISVVRIPAGTPALASFRLAGRGMPGPGASTVPPDRSGSEGARGDLHVKILIDVPDQLDASQRAAVEALARTLGPEAHPRRRAWDAHLRGGA